MLLYGEKPTKALIIGKKKHEEWLDNFSFL